MTFINHLKNIVAAQLPLLLVATFILLLVQVTTQGVYRNLADDPQILIAEETAQNLSSGILPKEKLSNNVVDIEKSSSTFVVAYDSNLEPVAGSGYIDLKLPTPPLGVFDSALATGENRITWEPRDNLRIAIVVRPIEGKFNGFVLVGRSLTETETRITDLNRQLVVGWFGVIGIILAGGYLIRYSRKG